VSFFRKGAADKKQKRKMMNKVPMMPDPEGEVNWTSARKLSAPSFTETAALTSFI